MKQLSTTNRILVCIILVLILLYFGAPFLIPFIFGIFLASLMVPLSRFMEHRKINRAIASLLSVILLFIVVGGTMFLLITQINLFVSDFSAIEDKVMSFIESSQNRIKSITNLSLPEQKEFVRERSEQIIGKVSPYVAGFFGGVFSTVFSFVLVLIYVFLILLYRDKIFDFLMMYVPQNNQNSAKETLNKTGKVAFQYLWGRVQVMILLGIMYYITFLLFGLPYALLFTLFGSIITIVPYIGPLISGLFPVLFSLFYFDSLQKFLIFSLIILVIQLIESYVLEPLILGKQVELNPLVIIVAIVIGGLMWGVAGMILFVPMIAILKIVAQNHEGMKPIGFLLGQDNKEEFITKQSTNKEKA